MWPSVETLAVIAVFVLSGAAGIGLFRVVVGRAVPAELLNEIERLQQD